MKTLKFILKYITLNFQREINYRIDAITILLSTSMYSITFVFALNFVFKGRTEIQGFTYDQMLIFLILSQCWWYLNMIFVRKSMHTLHKAINDGGLDFYLLKPFNVRALTPFLSFDFRHIIPLLVMLCILVWKLIPLNLSLIQILGVMAFTIISIIITFSFTSIFVCLNFWSGRNNAIFDLMVELPDLVKLPASFFPNSVEIFFSTIIPIALILNPVFQILYGVNDLFLLLYTIFYAIILFIISEFIWHKGLQNYSSAN